MVLSTQFCNQFKSEEKRTIIRGFRSISIRSHMTVLTVFNARDGIMLHPPTHILELMVVPSLLGTAVHSEEAKKKARQRFLAFGVPPFTLNW